MTREKQVADRARFVIFDPYQYPEFDPACFDDPGWRRDPRRLHANKERGGVMTLDAGAETWVRRHYHRGGYVSRLVYDHYWWLGLDRTRSFREWRLLAQMRDLDLPVPAPVAARVVRSGLLYQADLITVLLRDARPLSRALTDGRVDAAVWARIGAMLGRFHAEHIDHPDLTAHNILVGSDGRAHLLDFDNAHVRPGSAWCSARIARLNRSLNKVALETGTPFDESGWRVLIGAYQAA